MRAITALFAVITLLCASRGAPLETPTATPIQNAPSLDKETVKLADKRYEEMLDRMQAAVEEVAQLYGNPAFLQVFTNDSERASELKERLKAAQTREEVERELAALQKKRDDLSADIALKERESSRLLGRLVRQRAALDALSTAVEQARKAVEDTAK